MSWLLQQVLQEHKSWSKRTGSDDLVFGNDRGRPLNRSNLQNRVLRYACDRAKVQRVAFHSFRHAHATWHKEVGTHPTDVSGILGHASVNVTQDIYTHSTRESQRQAMDKIAERLSGGVLDTNGHKTQPGRYSVN